MQQLEYKKAFILHTRPFKENQFIAEVLVQNEGRLCAVGYKGSKKNSAKTALYNPFRMVQMQIRTGKNLHTIKSIEGLGSEMALTGKSLFCGFYLNELICRLCKADTPLETLFQHYFNALKQLQSVSELKDESAQQLAIELVLRRFEDTLLTMLGYGVNFNHTTDTDSDIEPQLYYELFEGGFVFTSYHQRGFLGQDVLAVGELLRQGISDALSSESKLHYLKCAKLILRASLQRHLGDKPLKSRELFRK